jgi:hypothetical protein
LYGPLLRIVSNPIDRHLARLTGGGLISPVDAGVLKSYLEHQVSERGIAEGTALTRCRYLAILLRDMPGPLSGFNEAIAKAVFRAWREKYRPQTFNRMVYTAKRFLEWTGREVPGVQPERKGKMTKTAAMMLTQGEVQGMIAAAWTSR